MPEIWSSTGFAAGERFDAWSEALNASFLPWQLAKPEHPGVEAELRQRHYNGFRFLSCKCGAVSGARASREIRTSSEDLLCLLHVVGGSERVSVDGHETELRPGDSLLWSSRHRVEFEVNRHVEKLTLMFSLEGTKAPSTLLRDFIGAPLRARHGLSSILSSYLRVLDQEIWALGAEEGERVMQASLDLLLHAFNAGADMRAVGPSATLHRIQREALAALADPELSPAALASSSKISLRYLHALFSREGTTVSRWIQQQRLERAREDLGNAVLAEHSITAIAMRWGFSDSSHFGRLFRQSYGLSPRAYRARTRN